MRKTIKFFEQGNIIVAGMRGSGKDMLFANVIARRKRPYISNTNYRCKKSPFIKLSFDRLNVKNNYKNFISGDIVPYDYPYPEDCDIYISDCGIYLPAQYCNELNKLYPEFPTFFALSRQIAHCNVFCNTQDLSRVWDKLREQADFYIRCISCKVLFKNWVVQTYISYDKYDSCKDRVEPYKHIPIPLMADRNTRALLRQKDAEMHRSFVQTYGTVKRHTMIYKNLSKYDTRLFKGVLSGEK